MSGIFGIDPDHVVVDVFALFPGVDDGFASVVAHFQVGIHEEDAVRILRIHKNLLVIITGCGEAVHLAPAGTAVFTAVHTGVFSGFHDGIHDIRIGRCDGQGDAAKISSRQAAAELFPGLSAVGTAENCTLRSAGDIGPFMPAALMEGSIHDIRIARIEVYFVAAGVFTHLMHEVPCFSAVGGFVESAFTAFVPQWSVGSRIHHIAVARICSNHTDMF